MKKLLFLCSFVLMAGIMNAQTTKKACSKKCSKTCAKKANAATTDAVKTVDAETQVASAVSEADIVAAAEADPAIVSKVCSVSGNASYYRESTCAKSGETSLTEVKYCGDSKAFVNVSPKAMEEGEAKVLNVVNDAEVEGEAKTDATKKACSKKGKKACTKGAKQEQ